LPSGRATDEYREAMLRGASLMWEERWEPAATAYRRALAARPDDPTAQRQLALALSRGGSQQSGAITNGVNSSVAVGRPQSTVPEPRAPIPADGALLGRTLSGHVSELSALPREVVRVVVEGLRSIERHQGAGRYHAAFDDAFALMQRVPTFLPLHVLLAELYTETGQWQAARDKLEAVEAAYTARATGDRGAAAA
jgi:predicted Zn-dependent protease